MKLETKEEYLVDSAIEMLYPTVTFNSYEAAVKHIHETPGTWRITKIFGKRLSERGRGETNHAGTATGNQGSGR
jgi:hypothetical protein